MSVASIPLNQKHTHTHKKNWYLFALHWWPRL